MEIRNYYPLVENLISAKPQPRKLEAWRKSGSAGLQPIIA